MNKYNHLQIEKKWQRYWEKKKVFEVKEDVKKEKFYALIEFPYPSGAGLHVGHPRSYTAMDILARKKRMDGYNVLYPIGFDSFGLPTENYAIKTGRPPAEITKENIANFTRQLKMLGFSFDWSRAVVTSEPAYYRWTQWIFLQFFKHGLAYKKSMPINWCLSCKIGLANEEVVNGVCERCGGPIEKRDKEQWMLAITKYADKLLAGLKEVDYIPEVKIQQENWIGRKEGINIEYKIEGKKEKIVCFTTRPDTNFGATFVVLGPEHPLALEVTIPENKKAVEKYIKEVENTTEIDRLAEKREKTGVFTGSYCVNDLNGYRMPIYIADYVLGNVGTGAVVGVPGHDKRDFEFADKFGIEVKRVVVVRDGDTGPITRIEQVQENEGTMINSEFLDGLDIHQATKKIIDHLEKKGWGKRVVNYKLRDWVFSRQRYWGEPIPLVKCEKCKNKKYNYIIIHGHTSNSQRGFKPWLKLELEKEGYRVYSPDLPNTHNPNIEEQAQFILDNVPFKIDDKTILVGHSLGGAVIYRLLEKINTKVAKVVLVDPVYKPEFNDRIREAVIKSCKWNFDFKKIKNSAEEFIVLGDKNFPIIKKAHLEELSAKLDCELYLTEPAGGSHFGSNGGRITQEPEVLRLTRPSGWVPVPEKDLPLKLPKVKRYQPTDTGESPLSALKDWVNTTCPKCGQPAKRETDTMPNWAGSSWYFLRYCDPHNNKTFAAPEKLKYWMPVDWYNGGMEHVVLHLLYSRFWNQFLYDIGAAPTSEPYKKRTSHGMILGEDGEKMSKSRGNVINPDEMVQKFGADAFRTYIMFMGPFSQPGAWSTKGVVGVRRFLEKVWGLQEKFQISNFKFQIKSKIQNPKSKTDTLDRLLHKTIKKVTEDIENFKFNTAVSALMILANEMSQAGLTSDISREAGSRLSSGQYSIFLKLLSPFAPHLCEELWSRLGRKNSIAKEPWPSYDPSLAKDETITLAIQVNGKLRDTLEVGAEISEDEVKEKVLASPKVQKWLVGKEIKKFVYIKGRLVNIVF